MHEAPYITKLKKKVGILRLTDEAFKTITEDSFVVGQPKFLPMLVPPAPWIQGAQMRGGYLIARTPFLRYRSKSQIKVLQHATIDPLLEGLDFLGSVPWMMNSEVHEVAKALYAKGEVIGEIPTKEVFPMPDESECYVPKKEYLEHERKKQIAIIKRNKNNLSDEEVEHKINELTKFNSDYEDEDEDDEEEADEEDESSTNLYADGDNDDDIGLESGDVHSDSGEDGDMIFDKNVMKYLTKKVQQKNQNNHSLRCDIEIKFSIAERFKNDTFYFPWNVDFRGRAYPVPPNLSHMGSDICRGMLTFAQPKALGPKGLEWLKCHLCNLFGYNKTNFQTRVQWSDDHLAEIFDSATKPLDGDRFWATSENPFQSLATCIEIYKAIQSGDPENYMCHLPVHQDGSCNGLQHYAALGRDKPGGQAVNLLPSERPQDVYSEVLTLVLNAIDRDILIAEDEEDLKLRKKGVNARLIHGHVNRKVIKQTVMTSVYGVTLTGARAQIMGKLKDKIYGDEMINRAQDDELYSASKSVA
jgi:DNA-directed RNA polymerase